MEILRQMIRYGLVSSVALAVDIGLLYLLSQNLGMNELLAAAVAFGGGLVVNYLLSLRWVFSGSKLQRHHEFIAYTVIGLAGLLLNELIIYLLITMDIWVMTAKLVSTGVVFFFNFFLRRMLYRNKTQEEG